MNDAGAATMRHGNWCELLDCDADTFDDLVAQLELVDLVQYMAKGEQENICTLRLTATCFDLVRDQREPLAPEAVVFTSPDQWARYCADELGAPAYVVEAPENRALFCRWCAHNVSLAEMTEAVNSAVASNDVMPYGLHRQLTQVRKRRLAAADSLRA